jgi:hypothetical protein
MDTDLKVRYENAGFIPSGQVAQFLARSTQLKKTYGYVGGEMVWIWSKGERALLHLGVGLVGFVGALTLLTILWRGCK